MGALGSRQTHPERLDGLRDAGMGEADLARSHGPVGLDLGGSTPADTALGLLAEIESPRHARLDEGHQRSARSSRPAKEAMH